MNVGAFDDAYLRQAPVAKGVPVPVGEFSLTREASATVLQRGADGRWAYGEEKELTVTLSDLEVAALPGTSDELFWSGITVRIDPDQVPEGSYWLVAAVDPASHFLFAQARLLPSSGTVKRALRADWLQRLAAGTVRIDELPFDPFEDGAGRLTARMGDPFRPHWQTGAAEEVGDGIFVDRSPNRSTTKRRWFFALCPENPDAVVMELVQQIQGFREDVAGGAVALVPRKRTGKANSAAEMGVDWQQRDRLAPSPDVPPKEPLMASLLEAAVRQGMAGRDRNSRVSLEWQIRTVYKDHFRDLEARLWRQGYRKALIRRGKAESSDRSEEVYKKFLEDCPECDYFRRNNRISWEMLTREQYDPAVERCRQRFLAYLGAEEP